VKTVGDPKEPVREVKARRQDGSGETGNDDQGPSFEHRPRHDAAGDRRGRRVLCLAAPGDCEGKRLSGVGTGRVAVQVRSYTSMIGLEAG
jgi:hypothetical protein